MKTFILLFCTLGFYLAASAQTPTRVCGTKFNDYNQNGIWDTGEPGMPAWTILLYDFSNNHIGTTTTDGNGNYCFDLPGSGAYIVREYMIPDWSQSFPGGSGEHLFFVFSGQTTRADFGNYLSCETDYDILNLFLNSGTDEFGNPIPGLITGSSIPKWTVISDPDPLTFEPRAAQHIAPPYPAGWLGPISYPLIPTPYSSEWMTAYNTSSNYINDKYIFQTCFCLEAGFTNALLDMYLRADDSAVVFLNNVQVGSTPNGSYALPATHISETDQTRFHPGENCISIELHNINGVAMGVNIAGFVRAGNAGNEQIATQCCNVQSPAPRATTGVNEANAAKGMLAQNVPNPFVNSTEIGYALRIPFKQARIDVYDLKGQLMKSIALKDIAGAATLQTERWTGGTYIYKLIADENVIDTKKMILAK